MKMKPPPLCLAWGQWRTRLPLRPRPPAAQIAPRWAGVVTTVAAALPHLLPPRHQWQRNPAGTSADAHRRTLLTSTSQVRVLESFLHNLCYRGSNCSQDELDENNLSDCKFVTLFFVVTVKVMIWWYATDLKSLRCCYLNPLSIKQQHF